MELNTEGINVEYIAKIGNERVKLIEEYIKLCLQPKPRWLPEVLWKWLLGRLLVIRMVESLKGGAKGEDMDTSETYIKMCDCPEIQEGKPQDGVSGTFIGGSCILGSYEDVGNIYHVKDTEGVRGCPTCGNKEDFIAYTKSTWLPRQDQLQAMVTEQWLKTGDYGKPLITKFYEFAMSFNPQPFQEDRMILQSWEQLWLAFVMKEQHNKMWTGTEWVSMNTATLVPTWLQEWEKEQQPDVNAKGGYNGD